MTKDANNEGYHCINCGKECGFLGCPDCYPDDVSNAIKEMKGLK